MGETLTGVNGRIIRWARENYNLGLTDAALALHVSEERYRNWEEGLEHPTYAKLKDISSLYRKPSAIFFFPSPPIIPDNKGELRTLPNTIVDKLSKNIVIQFEQARVYQINLRELCAEHSSIIHGFQISRHTTSEVAQSFRSFIQYPLARQKAERRPDVVLETFRERLYNIGIYVFKNSFQDDSVSGISVYDELFPVIIINNKMSFARQNFTLFHELYHLLIKSNGVEIRNEDYFIQLNGRQKNAEKACDEFASELLMPSVDFKSEISGRALNEIEIIRLSNLYSVSKDMILYRLLILDKISKDYYESLRDKFYGESVRYSKKDEETSGNYYNTKLAYHGISYASEVLKQYAESKFDIYKASDYLGVKVEHLSNYEAVINRGKRE